MGSIGQMVIGSGQIGASAPTLDDIRNIGDVQASGASFRLAADHSRDVHERLWFEAILYDSNKQPLSNGHFHQHTSPAMFTPTPGVTQTVDPDAEVTLATALDLAPNAEYWIAIRGTVDPEGEAVPSGLRWWTAWKWFRFRPVLRAWDAAVSNVHMWEDAYTDRGGQRRKDVEVPNHGICNGSEPFFEWEFGQKVDHFVWTITKNKADAFLVNKTVNRFVDTTGRPQFDGTWYFKVAPVWGGVVGQVYTHEFTIQGTVIDVT